MTGLGWTIVGTVLGGLGLLATLHFGIKDQKDKRKKEEEAKQIGIDLRNIPITPITKPVAEFSIEIEYRRYYNIITYTNKGYCGARNVVVNVEQSKTETVSTTDIVNLNKFPIEWLGVGDSFDVEVECFYKGALRCFTVEWEDEAGKHTQRNNLTLSKNYDA